MVRGRNFISRFMPPSQTRQLWFNGHTFTYERLREQGENTDSGDAGSLAATIPAIVSQILVQVGDTVKGGDKLILLESMKMVIPIQAPHEGTVTAIHCLTGEAVQPGIPLLTLA
ncbi:MAG: acetyl-CoA carboxylase biotin carboxyl carrier protein subunit [Candidatus Promineifilaceae bacterium]